MVREIIIFCSNKSYFSVISKYGKSGGSVTVGSVKNASDHPWMCVQIDVLGQMNQRMCFSTNM